MTDRQNENRNHCKAIAEEVERFANGHYYKCPECGECIEIDEEGEKITCPECGSASDFDDFETVSLYDYFDDILDIDYIIDSRKEYKACRIMVACGGPNIYINTWDKQVELYWWTESANYPMSYDVCDEIDAWAEELYNC